MCAPRRPRKIPVLRIDEHRIAEVQNRSGEIAELEGRIVFDEARLPQSEQSPECVWIRYASEAEIGLRIRPAPRPRKAFAGARDIVVFPRELEPNGTIPFRAAQAISRMPWKGEKYPRVVNSRGIDDDVFTEAALVPLLLLHARREDSSPVPVAVLVLPQMDERTLNVQAAQQDPSVEQISRIISHANRTGREEH